MSQYSGAAVAVSLFSIISPAAVAWLRLLVAAVVTSAWRRPSLRSCTAARLRTATAYGLVTGTMNIALYEAIERIPLGAAAAIEFCGPIAVGALLSRTRRDLLAVLLAAVGVFVITDHLPAEATTGVLLAAMAAVLYALKILLTGKIAESSQNLDDLAIAFVVVTVALAPVFLLQTQPVWTSIASLALVVAAGMLSTVIPYLLDQYTVRIVGPGGLAILLALLPATATVVGAVALGQIPSMQETFGIVLVMSAVSLRATWPRR